MKYNKNAHLSVLFCPVNPTTHDNVPEVQDFQICEKNEVPPFFKLVFFHFTDSPSTLTQTHTVCKASNNTGWNIDDVYSCYK